MKKGICATFLLVLTFAGYSYANSNLFYPYVNFAIESLPEAVAIGDVDGDGRNDVIISTS